MFNRSQSRFLVSFQNQKKITEMYKFKVNFVKSIACSMHGSNEGHTAFLYKKMGTVVAKLKIDERFKEAFSLATMSSESGRHEKILEKLQLWEEMSKKPRERKEPDYFHKCFLSAASVNRSQHKKGKPLARTKKHKRV